MQTPRRRSPPTASPIELRWQIWLVWSGLALLLWSATRTDPDLWGHVKFGLDWLDTRTLPSIDPYSFTQDRPWVNHEWLSEAFMATAYRLGGSAGLVILKLILMASTIAVVACRVRGATPLVTAVLLMLAIVCLLPLSTTVRPQLWSALGLALIVPLIDTEAPQLRHLMGAAALFCAWSNLHGGWITGGAVLATVTVVRVLRAPDTALRWIALGLISAGATLINPYGIGLWRFLAGTVRASRPDISEWQPLRLDEPVLVWLPIVAAVLLPLLLARRRETRPGPETWAVIALMVLGGLRVSRVAPLVAPVVLGLIGPNIRRAWGDRLRLTAPTRAAGAILLVPAAIVIASAAMTVPRLARCIPIVDDWAPDLDAAARLRGLSGRLWTTFDWGEYAIWHFGPALRVSIDGRRETVYSDAVVQLHRAFERGSADAQRWFLDHAPEYVWLRATAGARDWLARNGYDITESTAKSFIAVRRGASPLSGADAPLSSCFP